MNLPDFDFYAPDVISGGTDMMVKMKHAQLSPAVLVSIKNLSQLTNIYYEKDKGVVIGAMATHKGDIRVLKTYVGGGFRANLDPSGLDFAAAVTPYLWKLKAE